MNQKETPFMDAVLKYVKKGIIPFHTPGHIQGKGVSKEFAEFFQYALAADSAEVEHLESHHDYEAARKEAEKLLADLYKVDRSFFLCNGTTEGIQALILAYFTSQDTVLLPRNAHRSVVGGLILSGAKPKWVYPEIDREWKVATVVETEKWLEQSQGVSGAFHLYPNYYGMCQDLEKQVIDGLPNLVDEAHGVHLQFSDFFPKQALDFNITATVQSPHKILSSLTQSSWLHVKKKEDAARISQVLGIIETTSPNFLLWSSLDAARALEAEDNNRWNETVFRVQNLRKVIKQISGFKIFEPTKSHTEIYAMDPLKLMVSASDLGLDGFRFRDELRKRGIMPELAETEFVLFLITPAHQEKELAHLSKALEDISQNGVKSNRERINVPIYPRLKTVISPKEAFFSTGVSVKLSEADGCIAQEMIIPYPPGIPLIMPGEQITKEVIELTQYYKSLNWPLRGMEDKNTEFIRVIS
jgi:arginine decarboxylase